MHDPVIDYRYTITRRHWRRVMLVVLAVALAASGAMCLIAARV